MSVAINTPDGGKEIKDEHQALWAIIFGLDPDLLFHSLAREW